MFSRVISLLVLAAPLASALKITPLQNVNNGDTVLITWSAEQSDVPFTLELVNPRFNNEFAIANNLEPGAGSHSWLVPSVPVAPDYVIKAVNPGNISEIYDTTPVFAIGAIGSSNTSTSTLTATGTSTGTSTNTGPSNANELPITTSTTSTGARSSTGTGTATTNTATTSGTVTGAAASTTPSSAAVSSRLALTNACGYAVLLLSVVGGAVAVAL